MHCISPRIDAVPNQTLSSDTFLNVSTGFIMDAVTSLRTWCSDPNSCTLLKYYPNPKYYTFDDPLYGYEDGIAEMNGDTLIVRGDLLDLAITNNEITVYVGRDICTDITLDRSALGCKVPQTQLEAGDNLGRKTSRNLPFVRVFHGTNVVFDIGYIRSPSQSNAALIVSLISAVAILGVTILAVVLYKKSKAARREVEERRTDLVKMTIEKTEAVITVSGGFHENARE
ncbi:uncharacterized protein LOC110990518 [Acanthaster planci]|uniref:Uncharacterized protein LOC110990518 n=1 Tax=Acanthaster planci TaxID=133434 RepID=A0A8B8A2R3_ACAPL|nr:uncharacterized protein LOC110990518 [Acanthaster planci]